MNWYELFGRLAHKQLIYGLTYFFTSDMDLIYC